MEEAWECRDARDDYSRQRKLRLLQLSESNPNSNMSMAVEDENLDYCDLDALHWDAAQVLPNETFNENEEDLFSSRAQSAQTLLAVHAAESCNFYSSADKSSLPICGTPLLLTFNSN